MVLNDAQANQLAGLIQKNVPFVSEPYQALAESLGFTQGQVLDQLQAWQEEGKLREICGVMEGDALGYESALVAGAVPEDRLLEVAQILNQHPTITHNYQRNHAFNLWFTLATPKEMGLEPTLRILERLSGVQAFHPMPRTLTFKIGVNFDLESKANQTQISTIRSVAGLKVGEKEKLIIRALQTDLPYQERPFAKLAQRFDLAEEDLLEFARQHFPGAVRRYGGTFRHRKLGVKGNGMTVWNVPLERLEKVGQLMAQYPEVSHCYARSTVEGFPYSLYSMIHGPDQDFCRQKAAAIAQDLELDEYVILFSSQEFKKCRLRYFLPELEQWWHKHA